MEREPLTNMDAVCDNMDRINEAILPVDRRNRIVSDFCAVLELAGIEIREDDNI